MKIFVASPGRSGTRFFANVFRQLTDIPSFHEEWPKCINIVNEDINNHDGIIHEKTRKILELKIQDIENKSKDGNYFEANHMFIKAFVSEVVHAFRDDVFCIYIERDMASYLMSYTQKGRRTNFATDFQLQPHWRGNCLRSNDVYPFYPLVSWNWWEVRARFQAWKTLFENRWYHFPFSKINDQNEWKKLFDKIGIDAKPFSSIPPEMDKHSSNIQESMRARILKHLKDEWETMGKFMYPTDFQKLGIDKTPETEVHYEL